MTFTKDMLVKVLMDKMAMSHSDSLSMVELVLEEMKRTLELGQVVKISGFGKWSVLTKRTRKGRNPHTGQEMNVSARKVVTFRHSDTLRNIVNR